MTSFEDAKIEDLRERCKIGRRIGATSKVIFGGISYGLGAGRIPSCKTKLGGSSYCW